MSMPKNRVSVRRELFRCRYLYLLMLLPVIYFIVFKYVPMYGIQIAFRDFRVRRGIWGSAWVGFKHFQNYLTDPAFWALVKNTFILGGTVIVTCFPLPIVFALLLNELPRKGTQRLVQNISYLPHFISVVVIVSMTSNFLARDGLINQIIVLLGGEARLFMQDAGAFRPIYVLTDMWASMGWSAIIYSAALTGVDEQLYDAAKVDGAGRFSQILHVALPAIMPTISIMFIMAMGGILDISFEKTLLLQNPLTYETSDVISTYVYRKGLAGGNQFSYASAVDLFSVVVNLVFLTATNWICGRMGENTLW